MLSTVLSYVVGTSAAVLFYGARKRYDQREAVLDALEAIERARFPVRPFLFEKKDHRVESRVAHFSTARIICPGLPHHTDRTGSCPMLSTPCHGLSRLPGPRCSGKPLMAFLPNSLDLQTLQTRRSSLEKIIQALMTNFQCVSRPSSSPLKTIPFGWTPIIPWMKALTLLAREPLQNGSFRFARRSEARKVRDTLCWTSTLTALCLKR